MENNVFKVRAKGRTDCFEIVNEIPVGYSIWNIGMNMPEGWLPLCRMVQPNSDNYEIELDTLKTIRVPNAQRVLKASGYGFNTVAKMEQYIKIYGKSKNGRIQLKVSVCREALDVLRTVPGAERLIG